MSTISKRFRRLPNPSMLVALAALFVALGGSALAVSAAKNSVTSKSIRAGAVKAKKIADGAVKTNKLATGAVDGSKLADGSVSTAKVAAGAITGAKLADGSVSTPKLTDAAVTAGKLAPNSVGRVALADKAVGNAELDEDSVSVGKIEPGALSASRFYEATAFQFDFPQIAGNSCTAVQPSGFENLQSSDRILLSSPAGLPAPVIVKVTAQQNGIQFTACNLSTGAIDPPSLPYRILVIR